MPRLPTSLLLRARAIDPLLPLLLRPRRDLPSARNELRWLREHAQTNPPTPSLQSAPTARWQSKLQQMCLERARGRPIQYIIGNQPFGHLDILCKPGVLIPRPETEHYTESLARLLLTHRRTRPPSTRPPLRILDLCTGTGCIPLLLSSVLCPPLSSPPRGDPILAHRIHGIDISARALSLARKNLRHNLLLKHLPRSASTRITFARGDVLSGPLNVAGAWDVVVSNPPYISPAAYWRDTARDVRNWEPKQALVPPMTPHMDGLGPDGAGDGFYPRILEIADGVGAKIVVVEVADMGQAGRVAGMVGRKEGWDGCEIWRDWVCEGRGTEDEREVADVDGRTVKVVGRETADVDGRRVRVVGSGNGRVVVCWRGGGGSWIGREED